ncbi:MAG: hypothetical protein ABDI07_08520 [Candidatus Kryptonium sp.]
MRKLFLTFLFLTSTLFAQLPFFRPFFSTTDREFGKLFFYEVINLISEDTSKSRIDVNFRIANDLLTFVKNPLSSPTYIANFTISAEIIDKEGKSIARKIFSGHRATDNFEETNSKDIYTQGNFRFDLTPGNYRLILLIEDEQSNQLLRRERNITLKPFKPYSFETSDLTIIQESNQIGDTIILLPTNIGNRVNFGMDFTVYVQFTDKPTEFSYILFFLSEFGRKKEIKKASIQPDEITNNKIFVFKENPGDTIFTYFLLPSQPQNYYSLLIPFNGDSLDLGEYELYFYVKFKDTTGKEIQKAFSKRFTVEWIDMPFSLQNLDYAIEILNT